MRPIMAGKTSFKEIEENLSLCDLLDLHEAMDIEEEINAFANAKKD